MIDILEYELKYKNDRHVYDLLDAYKEEYEMNKASESMFTQSELDSRVDNAVDGMKEQIESYADDLDSALDLLESEDKDDNRNAVKMLENLLGKMR